jgi:hypothetical protein
LVKFIELNGSLLSELYEQKVAKSEAGKGLVKINYSNGKVRIFLLEYPKCENKQVVKKGKVTLTDKIESKNIGAKSVLRDSISEQKQHVTIEVVDKIQSRCSTKSLPTRIVVELP